MISSRNILPLARIPFEGEFPDPLCGLFFGLGNLRILPPALIGWKTPLSGLTTLNILNLKDSLCPQDFETGTVMYLVT